MRQAMECHPFSVWNEDRPKVIQILMNPMILPLLLSSLYLWGSPVESAITLSKPSPMVLSSLEVPSSTDEFEKTAPPIIERITPLLDLYRSKGTTIRPVIAIAGCSGVGKSYFSRQLLSALQKRGVQAKLLQFDDFLDPEPFEGALEEIHPHFDFLRAHAFLTKLLDGEELIEKPAWRITSEGRKTTEMYDLRGIELLIFEGEFTLCDATTYDLAKFSDVRVVLDADDEDIIRWDWERSRHVKQQSFEEFSESKRQALSLYRQVLEPLIEPYADFVVRKESSHRYVLSILRP